jgi:quinoprotein relay system zinc metallohydrolase 2
MAGPTRRNFLGSGAFFACCCISPARFAKAAATGNEALAVSEIADGVYAFTGAPEMMSSSNDGEICNVGFIIGDESVAVIDSGGSGAEGRRLVAAIRARTDRPIRYLINTHMHADHIFGNSAFEETGAVIVGHHNLARALASRGDYYLQSYRAALGPELMADIKIIPPSMSVTQEQELDLGKRRITLKAWKPAHTDNDLSVFDHKTRVFFTGDLCFTRHLPTMDGSLLGWIGQLQQLADIGADMAVPGHGTAPARWPQALRDESRYFDVLAADIRKAIADGRPIADAVRTAAQSERGKWHLFDEYNERNATAAYAELEWE